MSHYNSSSPPTIPGSTKPVYANNGASNAYVNSTPTYISSPFDDEPIPPASHNNLHNNSNGYNNYSSNDYQSPTISEKNYSMQQVSNQHQGGPYQTHNNYSRDSHDQPHYYNGYDEERPSLSNDTAPMRPHGDMETSEGLTRSKSGVTRVKYNKRSGCRCWPRSTCGRIVCCFCLLLLLAIIVIAILVFTLFKLPSVNYQGMQTEPTFQFNQGDTTLAVSFVANIQVVNPNPIGFKFESITATAYYPNYAPSIGGGNLTQVEFPSKATKVIHFPISASYSGAQDPGYTVVKDILNKCGVLGGAKTQLTINYDLKLSVRILLISISPTIKNQHVNVNCPDNISDIAKNIPGGIIGLS
ncbi:hypothetical protein B0O80DRAFT_450024 [Mortierella sp. GBAus27b]|nr:hypothetical protein BGX31_010783 [Mortierella sp. GBA43]KAI8354896.1 hypothetical protein B0O80DRAFT_450024 [Mortierella sp. GBAus27b]